MGDHSEHICQAFKEQCLSARGSGISVVFVSFIFCMEQRVDGYGWLGKEGGNQNENKTNAGQLYRGLGFRLLRDHVSTVKNTEVIHNACCAHLLYQWAS